MIGKNVYKKKMNYIYPYHQAIGFYLSKAGYDKDQLELLKNFNFCLVLKQES